MAEPTPDPVQDAIDEARSRLESRTRRMLGLDTQLLGALGTILSRGGNIAEVVVRELAQLCARMTLDPSAFFDAASLRIELAKSKIETLLRGLSEISDGRNALIYWSPKTRRPKPRITELDDLLRTIERARFARTEVQQIVRDDLIDAARAAAEALAERLRAENTAELPSASVLDLLVSQALDVEDFLQFVQVTKTLYDRADFTTQAILRVLEAAERELATRVTAIQDPDSTDTVSEADALGIATSLESILEALLTGTSPFGAMVVLQASLEAVDVNLVADVELQPVPRQIRGGRAFVGTIEEAPDADDATPRRYLRTMTSDAWDERTWFEQDVQIAHNEDLLLLGLGDPQQTLKASGTGTFVGEALASQLLDFDPGSQQINPYPTVASLPASIVTTDFAYVISGATHDLYLSNGTGGGGAGNWDLVESGVEVLGCRYFQSTDSPFVGNGVVAGDQLVLTFTGGTGAPATLTRTISRVGHEESTDAYRSQFGVTVSQFTTNETDWAASWEVPDPDSLTETTTWALQTSAPGRFWPVDALLGKSVTLYHSTQGWTHRFITGITFDTTLGRRLIEFDTALPNEGTIALYTARIPGFEWPSSRMAYVRSASSAEPLDLLPGDVLLHEGALSFLDPNDGRAVVFHGAGGNAVLDRPVHTAPEFQTNLRFGYEPESGARLFKSSSQLAEYISARRYRHLRENDTVLVLPLSDGSSAGAGYVDPSEPQEYRIDSLTDAGIVLRVTNETDTDSLPRRYARVMAVPPGDRDTDQVRVVDAVTKEPTALFDLDRRVRRLKADTDPDNELDDIWPTRSLTVLRQNRPVDATRVGEDLLNLGESVSLLSDAVPAQIVVRAPVQGYYGTLTTVRDDVQQTYTLVTSNPYPSTALSGTVLVDIESAKRVSLAGGTLAGTPPAPITVRTVDPLDNVYEGPVTAGGAKEYALWAWMQYQLQRRTPPDYSELREDLGRAYSDLGVNRRTVASGVTVTITDTDTRTATLSSISPSIPNAAFIEGMDLVGLVTPAPETPYRIERVLTSGSGPFTEVEVVLSALPGTGPFTGVTVSDTTVGQAWRELLGLVKYLDTMYTYLSAVRPPAQRVVADSAARLREAGFEEAARSVERAEFDQWLNPVLLSDRRRVVDQLNALVDSMLSRRQSVFDE